MDLTGLTSVPDREPRQAIPAQATLHFPLLSTTWCAEGQFTLPPPSPRICPTFSTSHLLPEIPSLSLLTSSRLCSHNSLPLPYIISSLSTRSSSTAYKKAVISPSQEERMKTPLACPYFPCQYLPYFWSILASNSSPLTISL